MTRNNENLKDIFTVLAEPVRRIILESLREHDQSVGELVKQVKIKQSGVSRHLRILSEAGLVESNKKAQKRIYTIKTEPLQELDKWLEDYRMLWDARIQKLTEHLQNKKGQSKK